MFFDNPNQTQQAFIGERQRVRLTELNALPVWSNEDFDAAFFCIHKWCPVQKHWGVSAESLMELMSNHRVPEEKAQRMEVALRRKAEERLSKLSN